MRLLRLALVAALAAAAPSLACDKIARTVEFLGWTADGRLYGWRVHETCVGCKPKWVFEKVYVRSIGGSSTEYITRWENTEYPRPEGPGATELAAWQARYPLLKKVGTAPVQVKQKGTALKPNRQQEWCARAQGPLELSAGTHARAWEAPSATCGCVRAFASPAGDAVAFVTGPAKRVCDDCHGKPCCGDVEGFALTVE